MLERTRFDCDTGVLRESETSVDRGGVSLLRDRRHFARSGDGEVVVKREDYAVLRDRSTRRETQWWVAHGGETSLVRRARYFASGRLRQLDAFWPESGKPQWKLVFADTTSGVLSATRFDEGGAPVSNLRFDASGRLVARADADLPPTVTPRDGKVLGRMRRDALARELATVRADLLFVGDSILQLFARPPAAVWNEYYGERRVVNASIGGDRIQHALARLVEAPPAVPPRLVVVQLGTNNLGGPGGGGAIADGWVATLALLRAQLPDVPVLLVGLLPTGPGAELDGRAAQIADANSWLPGLGDDLTLRTLDPTSTFADGAGRAPPALLPDGTHPSQEGYRLLAELLETVIGQHLGPRSGAAEEGP